MAESDNSHRAFGRRRRRNHPGGRDARIVVRVSPVEDQELRNRAEDAGMSVQRLLVTRALSSSGGAPVNHAEKVAAWTEATDIRNLVLEFHEPRPYCALEMWQGEISYIHSVVADRYSGDLANYFWTRNHFNRHFRPRRFSYTLVDGIWRPCMTWY